MTLEELANDDVKTKMRPREEWLERSQPHIVGLLPEPVRGVASARIEQYLESIADGKPKKPNRDRHRDFSYLFKGIIRSKQGNHLMTGRVGGKKGKEQRSYGVARGISVPKSNNNLSRRVPAQPLEDAIVPVVREVVRSIPDLQALLKEIILENTKTTQEDVEKPGQIEKEIKRKRKQLALLSDDVELDEDDLLTRKCNKIKAEIRALNLRLQQIPPTKQVDKFSADTIAAKFAKEILDSADSLGDSHNIQTYRLLELLTNRMLADLETKVVEIDFGLPSWMGSALQHGPVGLDLLSAYKPQIEAHPENGHFLASFRCTLGEKTVVEAKTPDSFAIRSGRKPACYTCRRKAKAA